jgi:hypothetical protein
MGRVPCVTGVNREQITVTVRTEDGSTVIARISDEHVKLLAAAVLAREAGYTITPRGFM